MSYCPECGGKLLYIPGIKKHVCQSCGLTLTSQELLELRARRYDRGETEEEKRERQRKEYLKWWFSSKGKGGR